MAQDATQLSVTLEARLAQFERQLKQAGVMADGQVRDIEDRFSRLNPSLTWATTAGNLIGRGLTSGLNLALGAIEDFIEKFKRIEGAAKLTGASMKDAFAIEKVLGNGGTDAFEKVATMLDRMKRGEKNELSKLFDANDVKNVNDAVVAFDKVADIIQRLPNSATAYDIGKSLGFDREAVDKLREATNEFGNLRTAASAAAPDLEKMAQLAKQFDDAWKAALDAVKSYVVQNAAEMAKPIVDFVRTTIQELAALMGALAKVGEFLGTDTSLLKKWSSDFNKDAAGLKVPFGDGAEGKPLEVTVNSRRRGDPSKAPSLGSKSGGGGGSDSLNAFEREERRANEVAARLDQETASLALNTFERTKNAESLRLRQMLEREGIAVTDDYAKRIDEVSTKLAKATAAQEQARQAQRQSIELQNFAGNELISVLDQVAERGATAANVMENLAAAIRRALLQAIILGQGPFAGILNMGSGSSGQPGGLVGALAGLLPGKARGGFVEGPGTGTSDSILTRLSNGEFVVNAKAAARHRHLLEALNAKGLARGGFVGMPSIAPPLPARGGGGLDVQVINQAPARIETSETRAPNGGRRLQIRVLEEMVAGAVGQPNSPAAAAVRRAVRPPVPEY